MIVLPAELGAKLCQTMKQMYELEELANWDVKTIKTFDGLILISGNTLNQKAD